MLKFRLDKKYPTVVRYVLEKRGWVRANPIEPFNLYWRNSRFSIGEVNAYTKDQKFNHFINSGTITKKAGISFQLKQLRKKYGNIYDIMPPSFVFTRDTQQVIREQLVDSKALDHTWIIKPSSGSQGRGIQIVRDLSQATVPDLQRIYTAQMYIQNPLLIRGYKFDIRLYALVTSFHPMTVYLFREGLVRFATEKYNDELSDSPDSVYKHLTNTSINKHSPIFKDRMSTFDFEISEALGFGSKSKRTLKQLISYLHHQDIDFRPIWNEIKKSVILSLLPLGTQVPKTKSDCFELYGFDFILDDTFKPWILEVNFAPSLGCECNVDQTVKEGLIEDIIDTLEFKPLPYSFKAVDPTLTKDFYQFMNRSNRNEDGSYGNFEKIFPFNEETNQAAIIYSENLDTDEQQATIVNNLREKYGQSFVPPEVSELKLRAL